MKNITKNIRNIALLCLLIYAMLIASAHAAGNVKIVSSVEGLGKYTEIEEYKFYPGDKFKLYIQVDDVNHHGFVAVNFYISIYNSKLQVMKFEEHNVRYRKNINKVYIAPEIEIPEDWMPGTYYIKVYAYDVADEDAVRKAYVSAFDPINPDFSKLKDFLDEPEGINVGGYSGFLKKPSWKNLILSRTIKFEVLEKKAIKYEEEKGVIYKPVKIKFFEDSHEVSLAKFIENKPFTFRFIINNTVHSGLVALDYMFIIINEKGEPIFYKESRDRYIRYSKDSIIYDFTYELPPGRYYLIVKIHDRANEKALKEFLDSFYRSPVNVDARKIQAYISIKEGRDVNDAQYSLLGFLKPKNDDNIIYFARIPFEVAKEVKIIQKEATAPILKYISLEVSNLIVNLTQPFYVKVKVKNVGKEGTVDIILDIRGEQKGYKLRKSLFMEPNVEKEVKILVDLPLTEGPWKISIPGTDLSTVVLVQSPEKIEEEIEEKRKEEELFKPPEIRKPKEPLIMIAMLIVGILLISVALRKRYGKIPPAYKTFMRISIAMLIFLAILYIIYLLR